MPSTNRMIQFRCVNFEVLRDEAVRSLFTPAIAPLGRRVRMTASPQLRPPPSPSPTTAYPSDCGRSIGEDRWVAVRPTEASKPRSATSASRRFCSLMGQGREALRGVDAFGCLRSLRARSALDGVSWVQRGSVEIAVGHGLTACYKIRAVVCSLPRASLLLGAGFGLLSRGLSA